MLTISTIDMSTGLTAAQVAQELVGPGITITNAKFTGDPTAAGTFSNAFGDGLGINSGVSLSSGKISNAAGPNTSDNTSTSFGRPGDLDLNSLIPGFATRDAAALEFDFVATKGTISFQYVFGSEEYNEFVNQAFNDVFGFFLDGKNIALIPGTNTPVSINNVNENEFVQYFRNNSPSDLGIPTPFGTQADGFTTPLQASASISAGTHHIKLAIADAGDTALDSWVFLPSHAFVSGKSDLAISASVSSEPALLGDPLTYTLVATNNGPDAATGVNLQDTLPAGVTFVGATTSQGTILQVGGVVTADLGSLASGASATVTVNVLPTTLGTLVNSATIQAFQVDAALGNNTVTQNTNVVSLKVSNVSQTEGDSGQKNFVFSITRSASQTDTKTVAYQTTDGTATAGNDYIATSGVLTFAPGDAPKFVTVSVLGDTAIEPDETFFLTVNDAVDVNADRTQGIGTIISEDRGFSVSDVSVVEGNSGVTNAVFTVSLVGAIHLAPVSVSYYTFDDTTSGGYDYLPQGGQLSFAPGVYSRNVTVPIIGDAANEQTETFFLNLSNPDGAFLIKGQGVGTITDNDRMPAFYVNDVHITTTEAGQHAAVFAVALDSPSGQTTTVDFATGDGSALAGSSYLAMSGTLTFPAGTTKQLVSVPVLTSAVYSSNQKFYLNLTNATNVNIADTQGVATIIYADPPGTEYIIDDQEEGYSQNAGWTNTSNSLAYHLDYDYHLKGTGSGVATWNFNNILPGSYQVFAKWIPFTNRATNAPYTIYDGNAPQGTVLVNQQLMPAGDSSNGVVWQSLGTFSTSSGKLAVKLSDNANGYVVADAIRIVSGQIPPQVPEMDVAQGDDSIDNGANAPSTLEGTDFGEVTLLDSSSTHTFQITNTGNADLHLTGSPRVVVFGANPGDFQVLSQPAGTIGPGAASSFQVVFHPTAGGLRQAVISIANDDDSEHPYVFAIAGNGNDPSLNVHILDDAAEGHSQTGSWNNSANPLSFGGAFRSLPAGEGEHTSTWTFTGLAAGHYEVSTSWIPGADRATDAPFTVTDGDGFDTTVLVNQQLWPSGEIASGLLWQTLTSLDVTTGTVTVSLSDDANGVVVADVVRLVRTQSLPAPPVVLPLIHNAAMPRDVNGDNKVSALDVLLVINNLLAHPASNTLVPAAALATSAVPAASTSSYYWDVNNDGHVSPLDALLIINFLNQSSVPVKSAAAMVPSAVDSALSSLNTSTSPATATPSPTAPVVTPTVRPASSAAAVATPPLMLEPESVQEVFGAADSDELEEEAS